MLVAATCEAPGFAGLPTPGVREYQSDGALRFAGGIEVNAIGGNLRITKQLIEVDNQVMIDFPIILDFNSSAKWQAPGYMGSGKWTFNFQMHFEDLGVGKFFVDDTGTRLEISDHVHGDPIEGTKWDYWQTNGRDGVRSKTGLVHRFDASGRLKNIDGPNDSFLQFSKIPGTTRVGTIWACTSLWNCAILYNITYNAGLQPATISDQNGRTVTLQWQGRVLTGFTTPAGYSTSFEHLDRLVSAVITHEGVRTEFEYDLSERVKIVRNVSSDVGDPETTFSYTPAGPGLYATEWTDALGFKRRFVYDREGRMDRIENADASVIYSSWTWSGKRPSSITDRHGITSTQTWEYDSLVGLVTPSGNVIGHEYAPGKFNAPRSSDGVAMSSMGSRARSRSWDSLCPDGNCLGSYTYDASGRASTVTTGAGDTTTIEYHYGGTLQAWRVHAPSGNYSIMDHYEAGHPRTFFSGVYVLPLPHKAFSPWGDTEVGSSFTGPPTAGTKSRGFNSDRMLATLDLEETSDPSADCQVSISRRSDGRPTYVARACGGDHEMSYNDLGWLTGQREQVSDGEGWSPWWTFEHDLAGQVTRTTDPEGRVTEHTYNEEGDLEQYHVKPTLASPHDDVDSWVFEDGRKTEYWTLDDLLFLGPQTPSETYSYTPPGQLGAGELSRVEFGDGTAIQYTYDIRGRVTTKRYLRTDASILRELGFEYDIMNRVIEEFDGTELLVRRTFDDGRLNTVETGNGLTRTLNFPGGVFSGATTKNSLDELIESSVFRTESEEPYEPFNPDTPPADPVNENQVVTASTTTYWDGAPRTTSSVSLIVDGRVETSSLDSEHGTQNWDFEFDFLGNMISEGGSSEFSFNAGGNRLLTGETIEGEEVSYSYNDAGQVISRNGQSISWTSGGCMASHGPDTLEWNGMCTKLRSKSVGGVTTLYQYGGEVELVNGNLRISKRDYRIDLGTSERLYLHRDNRGNTSFITNQLGEVITHYGYSPFRLEVVYGADENEFTFVGRAEVGQLMILGARMYDPVVGRFLSQDPIFQLVNQYFYTNGNPIQFSDRGGYAPRNAEDLIFWGGVAIVVGGTVLVLATGGGVPLLIIGLAKGVSFVGSIVVLKGSYYKYSDFRGARAAEEAAAAGSAAAAGAAGPLGQEPGGNGSGGNSAEERWRQCVCNGNPRLAGKVFFELGLLFGWYDGLIQGGFGGFLPP